MVEGLQTLPPWSVCRDLALGVNGGGTADERRNKFTQVPAAFAAVAVRFSVTIATTANATLATIFSSATVAAAAGAVQQSLRYINVWRLEQWPYLRELGSIWLQLHWMLHA